MIDFGEDHLLRKKLTFYILIKFQEKYNWVLENFSDLDNQISFEDFKMQMKAKMAEKIEQKIMNEE